MPGTFDIRKQLLIARLPALPQILVKLIEYCQEDDVGIDRLAELIGKDAAIVSKILATASSTAYRRNGQKIHLEQALISLGTDLIRTLAISESIFQTFSRFPGSGITDLRRFWKHSLTVAVVARDMAKAIGYPNIDEAYLGGLLHDIGRLAFLAVAPNKYAPTFHLADGDSLCTAEQETLHITHQEAGAWLIERWKLSPCLADSVLYHHEPISRVETAHLQVRIVHAAHLLCSQGPEDKVALQACALCDLSADALETIYRNAGEKVGQSARFLGIELDGVDDDICTATKALPDIPPQINNELHNIILASEAGRTFALQTDKAELLEMIVRSACILLKLDDAIIFELDQETQALLPADERRQRLPRLSIPVTSEGLVAEAATQQRPAFTSREQTLIGIAEAQLLRTLNAEALICLPLVLRGNCLGALVGGASAAQMKELEQNIRFMQVFASQAASAIHALNARQNTAMQQASGKVEEFRIASLKMAHEVNNPLAIIKNYLSLLNGKLMKQEPIGSEITILNQEIDRVSKILRQFANPQPDSKTSLLDVNAVILEVARLFGETGFASESTQITTQTQNQPPHAECDQELLMQILTNLVKNAIESMQHGGQVQIANMGHAWRNEKRYLQLTITDTGPGIPPEILANLFQPVRSIQPGDPYRGLGLSIVHDLIRKSNGQISCRSGSNGTSFEILLPADSSAEPNAESQPGSCDHD